MQAAVYYGQGDLRIEEIDENNLEPDEVRLDVAACGICGTDLHEYQGGPIFAPSEPHPLTGESLPVRMGHEFGGVVTEAGSQVDDVAVGDSVTVNPMLPCDACRYCEAGRYNLCEDIGIVGLSFRSGGFAESAVVPAANVHCMPDGVPVEYAALVEPLSVGLHAIRRSGLAAGDSIAIFGAGPIGQTVIQAACASGAGDVFVSEPRDSRRELADEMGATDTIDPQETNVPEYVADRTDGGVDVSIEVAGVSATFGDAIVSTHKGGHVTVASISEHDVSIDFNDVVVGERSINGTMCYAVGPASRHGEFEMISEMLGDGRIDPEPFVTGRIALSDIVEAGFEPLLDPESEHVKILVQS